MNSSMVDTYCHTITSNNIDGRVLLHCKLDDLKSVLNMNFGDWETFKLVVEALREDEQSSSTSQRERVDATEGGMRAEGSQERGQLPRSKESKFRQHKVLTSMERQVAMEEATVSGLLSTLNEEAKEDIMQEEINTAKEEAEAGGGRGREEQEADYLYYAHAGPAPVIDEGGEGSRREEEGLTRNRLRSSGEMIWSASNSRHGSLHDLASPQVTDQPASAGVVSSSGSVHTKRRLDMADRAKTVVSLTREEERRGEADPYAWLSVTAPASPRHSLRELSSQVSTDRESDPGTQQSSSMWPRRSMRKTRKAGEGGRRQEDESDGETSPPTSISRTGSVAKLHKVARKIKSAMGSHDTGQLPAVRRARPNMEVSRGKYLA